MELWCNDKFDEDVLRQELAAVTQATGRGFLVSVYQSYDRQVYISSHWILQIYLN